ncbi:MAG TPA: glycosyltransferase family 2 protein [Thermoanaerobaculia bacterium]
MTKPSRVSVAILSWNGRHHLETCLAALAAQSDPGVAWEVLILDNGSTDGTAGWWAESGIATVAGAPVRLVRSEVNLGFCGGNNRLVAESTGDAVAFLNNDTRPEPRWLAGLVAALAAAPDDVAAVSGMIVDWEGRRLDFGRGVMTFDGHAFQLDFRRPLAAARIPEAGEELLFACGGNMLIRRASFLAAGGFDEDYFAYLEDVDLGWRLWSGGERVLFTPAAVVHHRSGATSDLLGLYNRGFLFERNAFLTAYKNYEAGLWERLMPALLLTFLSRTQTMLADNNPGGSSLRLDPYAGWIANTAAAPVAPATEANGSAPLPKEKLVGGLARRWRDYGPRDFARRGLRKLTARLRPTASPAGPAAPVYPTLTDERTIAQLRALAYLLRNLDGAAARRAAVAARRRRSDREIFARFPLYLVPTYPGDAALFGSSGFAAWLPDDLPLVRRTLGEVMEVGE